MNNNFFGKKGIYNLFNSNSSNVNKDITIKEGNSKKIVELENILKSTFELNNQIEKSVGLSSNSLNSIFESIFKIVNTHQNNSNSKILVDKLINLSFGNLENIKINIKNPSYIKHLNDVEIFLKEYEIEIKVGIKNKNNILRFKNNNWVQKVTYIQFMKLIKEYHTKVITNQHPEMESKIIIDKKNEYNIDEFTQKLWETHSSQIVFEMKNTAMFTKVVFSNTYPKELLIEAQNLDSLTEHHLKEVFGSKF